MSTSLRNALAFISFMFAASSLTACESPEAFVGGSLATVGILGFLALILIIVAIIDLIRRPMELPVKIIWGLVIWFLPIIGAIIYLIIGRK